MGTSGGRLGSHGDEEKSPQSRRRDEKSVLYAAAAAFLPHKYSLPLAVVAAPLALLRVCFYPGDPLLLSFYRGKQVLCLPPSPSFSQTAPPPPPPTDAPLERAGSPQARNLLLPYRSKPHSPPSFSPPSHTGPKEKEKIRSVRTRTPSHPRRSRRRRRTGFAHVCRAKMPKRPVLCGGDNVTFSELLENVSWSPETTFSSASVVAYKRRFYLLSFRKSPVLLRPGSSVAYLGIRAIKKRERSSFPRLVYRKIPSFGFLLFFRGIPG